MTPASLQSKWQDTPLGYLHTSPSASLQSKWHHLIPILARLPATNVVAYTCSHAYNQSCVSAMLCRHRASHCHRAPAPNGMPEAQNAPVYM
jgi:hypothetical protein